MLKKLGPNMQTSDEMMRRIDILYKLNGVPRAKIYLISCVASQEYDSDEHMIAAFRDCVKLNNLLKFPNKSQKRSRTFTQIEMDFNDGDINEKKL